MSSQWNPHPTIIAFLAEAICRVKWLWRCHSEDVFRVTWLWRWLPHRLLKRQSLTTVLLRTPITQMIFFNQGMLLLGSNHFLNNCFLWYIMFWHTVYLAIPTAGNWSPPWLLSYDNLIPQVSLFPFPFSLRLRVKERPWEWGGTLAFPEREALPDIPKAVAKKTRGPGYGSILNWGVWC